MAGNKNNVDIGACEVFWTPPGGSEIDLGYTSGGVTITFAQETQDVEVDQELDPINSVITKCSKTVRVPLAEFTLDTLHLAFPGSEIITDGTTASKKKLLLKNAAGGNLKDYAGTLRLRHIAATSDGDPRNMECPVAAPNGNIEFTYDKLNAKITNIEFVLFPDENGVTVIFGDKTATAAVVGGGD